MVDSMFAMHMIDIIAPQFRSLNDKSNDNIEDISISRNISSNIIIRALIVISFLSENYR